MEYFRGAQKQCWFMRTTEQNKVRKELGERIFTYGRLGDWASLCCGSLSQYGAIRSYRLELHYI